MRVDARGQQPPDIRDVHGLELERLRHRKARRADLKVVVRGSGFRVSGLWLTVQGCGVVVPVLGREALLAEGLEHLNPEP